MSVWKPGFRHYVTSTPEGWRCRDCRQTFADWPSDDVECPGPPATTGPLMDIGEFTDLGFLQEVNRLVLHPAGLALSVQQDEDGTWHLLGIHDWRDDPEGVCFADGASSDKRQSVRREWARHAQARAKALGGNYETQGLDGIVQPIGVIPSG